MHEIIRTYIASADKYTEASSYEEALNNVSSYRADKIAGLKNIQDKRRSLAAAAALDAALSEYELREKDMEYGLLQHGKPYLKDHPKLHFSLSHSGAYAICSIASLEVGSDIECVKEGKENIARRFFTPQELEWLYNTARNDKEARNDNTARNGREAASDVGDTPHNDICGKMHNDECSNIYNEHKFADGFFRIWTMKESFLKVTGLGMSLPLTDFTAVPSEKNITKIRQNINEKTYYVKEYEFRPITGGHKPENYKISVCCENINFADEICRV